MGDVYWLATILGRRYAIRIAESAGEFRALRGIVLLDAAMGIDTGQLADIAVTRRRFYDLARCKATPRLIAGKWGGRRGPESFG